jgi:hypothetical protein
LTNRDVVTYEAFSQGLRKGNLKYPRKHHSNLTLKLEERTNTPSNMYCHHPPAADVPYYRFSADCWQSAVLFSLVTCLDFSGFFCILSVLSNASIVNALALALMYVFTV